MNSRASKARRPEGWLAPGPKPLGDGGDARLLPSPDEDLSYLAGDWRIFQPKRGHRWSLDDLVTAHVAVEQVALSDDDEVVDLGCGLASVLMLVAWARPRCRFHGVEAQLNRAQRARRSLRYNGAHDRCRIVTGDLREVSSWRGEVPQSPRLVTGTPPYFDTGATKLSKDEEAAACRAEVRGGLEVYLDAGCQLLRDSASLVLCYPQASAERAENAAKQRGLFLASRLTVIPSAGKPPLIVVDRFQRQLDGAGLGAIRTELVVRDGSGRWTEDFRAVRRQFGMPDVAPRPPGS